MEKSTHKGSRRFALCSEFGGGKWRMIFFFPLEEILVPPFPGAQRGKWFEQIEGNDDNEFHLVDENNCQNMSEIEVKMDGLEENVCLKIRLPVTFLPSPHIFGFSLLNQQLSEVKHQPPQKFISSIDPAIAGDVLFDFTPSNGEQHTSTYYAAFVSLTSFNARPTIVDGHQQQRKQLEWSIHSAMDILGQWDNLVPNSHSSSTSPSTVIELREKSSSSPPSAECPRFGQKERIRQIPEEEERHHSLVICWERTTEDSFLLEFNLASTLSPITRLQCNNKLLKIEIELGAWYSIEYSKYRRSKTHIYIHQIILANAEESLMKTRLLEGDVQFNVAIRRGLNEEGWETCLGLAAIKITEVPKELDEEKGTILAWCTFGRRFVEGKNCLKFEEASSTILNSSVAIELDYLPNTNNPSSNYDENIKQKMTKENITTVQGPLEYFEEKEEEIIKEYEEEIPFPEQWMMNAILAKVNCGSKCRLEKCQESINSIRIVGSDKKLLKECVQRVRTLRKMMMEGKIGEGMENTLKERNGLKGTKMVEEAVEPMEKTTKMHQLSVKIPKKYHGCVIGKEAANLDWMCKKFNVTVELPNEFSPNEEVEIKGICPNEVNKCKQHLLAMIKGLESRAQCADQIILPPRIIPLIIGKDGNKMRKLREQFPNVKIDGPHRGDGGLMQFRGQKEEVKKLRAHLANWISELEQKHHEEIIQLPMNDPNHSPVEFLKFLRGTNCDRIRNLQKQFPDVKIDFPIAEQNDGKPMEIILDGPVEDVGNVKKALEMGIEELKALVDIYVPIESKYFEKFLRAEGKLLREIKDECKCQIHLNKAKCLVEIRGKQTNAENAQKFITKILDEMEEIAQNFLISANQIWTLTGHFPAILEKYSVKCKFVANEGIQMIGRNEANLDAAKRELMTLLPVTETQEVPKEYRRKLMVDKAEKMKQMEMQHNVQIQIDASQNGQSKVELKITGSAGNVQSCMAKIQSELPIIVIRNIKIPKEFRSAFIGRGGELVKQMERKYSVRIKFSTNTENEEDIRIEGEQSNVEKCMDEYGEKCAEMEKEKQRKSFKLSLTIPYLRGKLIGCEGKNVRELEARFGVKIHFGLNNNNLVDISGIREQCELCQDEIRLYVNGENNFAGGGGSNFAINSSSNIRTIPSTMPKSQQYSSKNRSDGCILM